MRQGFDLRHVSFSGKPPAPRRVPATAPARVVSCPPALPDAANDVQGTALDDFGRWLLAEAGIDPGIYRLPSLRRRVAACLRALQVGSVDAARDAIRRDRARLGAAVNALLIGVTDFFRDPAVADTLRERVLPSLARQPGPIRAWSAGCSSGPELYSFAMLLSEAGLLERSTLLGTDCRADAIASARSGVYEAGEVGSLPADLRSRYLESVDGGWRIVDRLRARVRWRVADLGSADEPGPWDLILWRNVAIYLNPDTAGRILARMIAALRPGGYLVLGNAERAPSGAGVAAVSRCVYTKRGVGHVER